jgi:hypothetical protein
MNDLIYVGLTLEELHDLIFYLDISDNENLTLIKEKLIAENDKDLD